jgi:FixJ family two-component response regulator
VNGSRTVYVIDDDREVRTALSFLLRSMDIHAWPFSSGGDFLHGLETLKPGLILLDMRMPEPDGLGVLRNLSERKIGWPVIAMTGHGDVKLAVDSMKLGAFDFLEKPIEEGDLSTRLESGFVALGDRCSVQRRLNASRDRIAVLTGRERAVLLGIANGQLSKEIASTLGMGVRTVEMHRNNLIRKLGVRNTAEAIRCAVEAELADRASTKAAKAWPMPEQH